jgi:hypothetical protein
MNTFWMKTDPSTVGIPLFQYISRFSAIHLNATFKITCHKPSSHFPQQQNRRYQSTAKTFLMLHVLTSLELDGN